MNKTKETIEAYEKRIFSRCSKDEILELIHSNENIYGKSITDPCLGWADSEKLVCDLMEYI